MADYSDTFGVVEVQRTFYSLLRVTTAERWRRRAGEDFRFFVKCWQVITHTA